MPWFKSFEEAKAFALEWPSCTIRRSAESDGFSAFFNEYFHQELKQITPIFIGRDIYSSEFLGQVFRYLSIFKNLSSNVEDFLNPNNSPLCWLDEETGLTWDVKRIFHNPKESFKFSKNHTVTLNHFNYGGFSDWRGPTLFEMRTLLDRYKKVNYDIKFPFSTTGMRSHKFYFNSSVNPEGDNLVYNFVFDTTELINYDNTTPSRLIVGHLNVRGSLNFSPDKSLNFLYDWASANNIDNFPYNDKNLRLCKSLKVFFEKNEYKQKNPDINFEILPDEIINFESLEELVIEESDRSAHEEFYLSGNLFKLTNLKKLTINCNLKKLSPEIGNLKNLTHLDISENALNFLPESIVELEKLNDFAFNFNVESDSCDPPVVLSKSQVTWLNLLINNGCNIWFGEDDLENIEDVYKYLKN
jgi:Leucine-rich repeat (LRR) protein